MSPGNESAPNSRVDAPQEQGNGQGPAPTPSLISNPVVLPRRRQAVTSACKNCRRRRVRCNGARPKCSGCVSAGVACEWTAPPGLTSLQAEKEKTANYESVMELLRTGNLNDAMQALQRLRTDGDAQHATASIVDAQLLLTASTSTVAPSLKSVRTSNGQQLAISPREVGFSRTDITDARDLYVDQDVFVNLSTRHLPLSKWTSASNDDKLMNHLLNMFFAWDNVVERAIYRPIFEEDVMADKIEATDPPPGRFCTRFLINAMLAASCLYTMDPATLKDVNVSTSRGRIWADEAIALLEQNPAPSLPLLQGLYCLFVYEGNIGSGERSVHYWRRAMQVYQSLNEHPYKVSDKRKNAKRLEQERHAISWCMWGFYCCEWRATQALGFRKQTSPPKIEKLWHESTFALSQPECPSYWWIPYPNPTKIQRSMRIEIRDEDVRLAHIVEEALDLIYPLPGGKPPVEDPQRMLDVYDTFIDWRMTCQPRIRFEEAVLPAAILLHIGVEVMLTVLLRPFTHLTIHQLPHSRFDPRERCYQHAAGIMTALWTYRAFAILRYEYWLTYVAAHAAYIALREAVYVPMHMDTVIRACQCLKEMSVSYPLANDSLLGILAAFKRCKIVVPRYLTQFFEQVQRREGDGDRLEEQRIQHHTVAALLLDPEEEAAATAAATGEGDGGEMRRSELRLRELLTEVADWEGT